MPFTSQTGHNCGLLRAKNARDLKNSYNQKVTHMNQAERIKVLEELVLEASNRNDEDPQQEPLQEDQFVANDEVQILEEQNKNVFTQKKMNYVSMQIRSTAATEYYLQNTTDPQRKCCIRTIMNWKAKMYDNIFQTNKLNVEKFVDTVLNISKYSQMQVVERTLMEFQPSTPCLMLQECPVTHFMQQQKRKQQVKKLQSSLVTVLQQSSVQLIQIQRASLYIIKFIKPARHLNNYLKFYN
ncbi:Hypothetical_protein [Hexamita inflata]|uniref:Hypothetical_protein n=1 Tax=Hexamita inflata TaxID=28002 RepID=A0AA86P8Y9_9EUKA|nr:Hypothetical protein HINF_LOCUS20828 [Hexamita inflata]